MLHKSRLTALLGVGALVGSLAACGGGDEGGDGGTGTSGGSDEPIVLGTTDTVVSLDPAGTYDLGSWTLIYNTYQNLLSIEPGGNTPSPDAAESCEFTDKQNTTYVCTLQEGLTFQDGSELTAEDVVFSIERLINIEDVSGGYTLLTPDNLQSVKATGDLEVTMQLKEPDATWPFRLTTGAAAIVPSDSYPADELVGNTAEEVVGSGPYEIAQYEDGQRAQLVPFEDYQGPAEVQNGGAVVSYFPQESALALAIENGDIDVAYRSLSPTTVESLRSAEGVEIVEGAGTEIRYIVFNVSLEPGDEPAARQAMAMLIDRDSIAQNIYNGTVEPLYSMVPQGLQYATRAFAEEYGEQPDPQRAAQTLQRAGIQTPVDVELWWTPSHYGPVSADAYAEIQRQLETDDLFNVTLQSAEWNQYSEVSAQDQYPAFQLGWFPDFPDADNYTAPFFVDGGFYNSHYTNQRINELVAAERATTNRAERERAFAEIQQIAAEEVPTIPVWQGKQLAAIREGVSGVQDTFDPSFVFRLWLVSKSG